MDRGMYIYKALLTFFGNSGRVSDEARFKSPHFGESAILGKSDGDLSGMGVRSKRKTAVDLEKIWQKSGKNLAQKLELLYINNLAHFINK